MTLNKNRFTWIKSILSIFGLLIIAAIVDKVSIYRILDTLKEMSKSYLLLAISMVTANFLLSASRLKIVTGTKQTYLNVLQILMYSMLMNYIISAKGFGQMVKVGLFKLKGDRISNSMAGVSSELILDIAAAGLIFLTFLFWQGWQVLGIRDIGIEEFVIVASIFFGMGVVVGAIYYRYNAVREFVEGIFRSFRGKNLTGNLVLTILIWITLSLTLQFYLKASGIELNFWMGGAAVAGGFIAGIFSLIPGGLGVNEFTTAYIMSITGVPLEQGLTITIISRLVGLVVIITMLFISWCGNTVSTLWRKE